MKENYLNPNIYYGRKLEIIRNLAFDFYNTHDLMKLAEVYALSKAILKDQNFPVREYIKYKVDLLSKI